VDEMEGPAADEQIDPVALAILHRRPPKTLVVGDCRGMSK